MDTKGLRRSAFALGLLMCSGCTTNDLGVDVQGALPSSGSYAFADAGEAPDLGIEGDVDERLRAKGLIPAAGADYLVDIGAAERPAGAGLLIPGSAPPSWLRPPDPSRRRAKMRTLTITMSDRQGREVFRATASARGDRDHDGWTSLLDQLISGEPGQHVSSPRAGER